MQYIVCQKIKLIAKFLFFKDYQLMFYAFIW